MTGYKGMGDDARGAGRLLVFGAGNLWIALVVLCGVVAPVLLFAWWVLSSVFG